MGTIGGFIRKTGFWTLDIIKGCPVRKRYNYLLSVKEGKVKSDALKNLLSHAKETVPYYAGVRTTEIDSFPVVNKDLFRKNYDAFRSSKFQDDSVLHAAYTSGSTGTPFKALQNREKIFWHQAGLIALNESIGWQLGERFMFMRVWDLAHSASKLSQFMSNTIPFDVVGFSDTRCEEVRQRLRSDKSLKMIIGYASALEKLSQYVIGKGDQPKDFGMRLIIADSENLTNEARKNIESSFGCPVYNRYANNENGIIALAGPDNDEFVVNYPEYYVEILNLDSDTPVKEGEMGRVVITDLYNYAFPFIRYDTGDLGIAGRITDNGCEVISQLMGRVSSSLFDTDGGLITETSVIAHFEDIPEIGRHQVVQLNKKEYELRIESTKPELDSLLMSRLKKCMGEDAIITIKHVEHVEQGKNGKIPVTINRMK